MGVPLFLRGAKEGTGCSAVTEADVEAPEGSAVMVPAGVVLRQYLSPKETAPPDPAQMQTRSHRDFGRKVIPSIAISHALSWFSFVTLAGLSSSNFRSFRLW